MVKPAQKADSEGWLFPQVVVTSLWVFPDGLFSKNPAKRWTLNQKLFSDFQGITRMNLENSSFNDLNEKLITATNTLASRLQYLIKFLIFFSQFTMLLLIYCREMLFHDYFPTGIARLMDVHRTSLLVSSVHVLYWR